MKNNNNYTFLDYLLMTVSFGVSSLGLLIIAGALISISEGKETNLFVSIILILIFGIGPVVGGYYMFKNLKIRRLKNLTANLEGSLLHIAKNSGGEITPAELALESGISIEEAKDMLDKLQIKGFATIEVNDEGKIYYKFDLN